MLATLLLIVCCPQQPASVTVALKPAPVEQGGPRWSPKAESVPLTQRDAVLSGSFALGLPDAPLVAVRLFQSASAVHWDQLWVDANRDQALTADELLTAVPKETRGKWWSSFETVIAIANEAGKPTATRPYPISLWFVEDPKEPDAKPALRWTRRGWYTGQVEIDGKPAYVLVTEMHLDGVFDQRDAWALARDPKELARAEARSMEKHCWLDGKAWRATAMDPQGASLTIAAFDPGFTEAEEKAKADIYKADREAKRAASPLSFGNDVAAALVAAKAQSKRVFVDVQTTWCGPCKQMEQWVYTAQSVVDAAKNVIAVQLDGDVARDFVKRYQVAGYPTMLLLDAEGQVLRRVTGYQTVVEMVAFLQ
jgi:thiol-disulfide isomerase/thioredoxin